MSLTSTKNWYTWKKGKTEIHDLAIIYLFGKNNKEQDLLISVKRTI